MTEEGVKLIEPTEALQDAYIEYLEDFRAAGETIQDTKWRQVQTDFAGYVRKMHDNAKGINLPEGYVPYDVYWLVRNERILGECSLRHELTDALMDYGGHIGYAVRPSEWRKGYGTLMLKLVLDKACALGIRRALITCDADNIASACVIQKNGGILDSESHSEQSGRITRRYWINLKPGAENDVCD